VVVLIWVCDHELVVTLVVLVILLFLIVLVPVPFSLSLSVFIGALHLVITTVVVSLARSFGGVIEKVS
jgi:hypothetical protein